MPVTVHGHVKPSRMVIFSLNAVFCNCSGGFSKKPWEVIFGQTLQVDLLESALKGDYRCRFAVHLPEKLEIT